MEQSYSKTADAAAAKNAPAVDIVPAKTLGERKYDIIFIVVFSAFVFTSFAADMVNAVSRPDPNSGYFWARAVYNLYAVGNDPLLIANPTFLRMMTAISAFVFGPFYIFLVIAFIKGWNKIRPFALIYAGMIIESMIVLLGVEFIGDFELFQMMGAEGVKPAAELAEMGLNQSLRVMAPGKFMLYNLPYKLFPLLLAVRMWRPKPFSRGFV
jgi:hypothetical protein